MAIAILVDMPDVTQEQYVIARSILGDGLEQGNLVHLAGPIEGGWRVVEVWESQEAMHAFFASDTARQAFETAQIPLLQPMIFPVHTLVAMQLP